ncbi:NnrU family protein [Magnetospira thiophila]
MTGTLTTLALASLAFVGSHMLLSWPVVRGPLVARLGEWPFRGLYSLIAALTLVWMVVAYQQAPKVVLWVPPMFFQHLPMTGMLMAALLLVAGYTVVNPTSVGMEKLAVRQPLAGIIKITRHPVMWAMALWGICHVLALGDAGSALFFGGLAFLALAGSALLDRRKAAVGGLLWQRLAEETSHVPFVAILQKRSRTSLAEIGIWRLIGGVVLFGALMFWHSRIFGVNPLPGIEW